MPTPNIRVLNTEDLRIIDAHGHQHHLNRVLDLDHVDLDPDGAHLLILVLYGHNMDNPGYPLHHRCRLLAKTLDHDEPLIELVDVLDTDWARLVDAETFANA